MALTDEQYVSRLGRLIGNFHFLELSLRLFLNQESSSPLALDAITKILSQPIGTELEKNFMTNYDSLGFLIKKFNEKMKPRGQEEMDSTIVEVRDALAHGRVTSKLGEDEQRLLKFDKPKNNKVRVAFSVKLTSDWFGDQNVRVQHAVNLVVKDLKNLS